VNSGIILLRQGPQELPYSQQRLQIMILAYVASGTLVLQGSTDTAGAVANMVVDVLVILLYTQLVLGLLNRKPRFVQTAS
jgi:hypothetical protein